MNANRGRARIDRVGTRRTWRVLVALIVSSATWCRAALADPAPFDLAGPSLEVQVTRGGITLPIAEVPELAVGDRLSIKADFPATQSAHYLMVASFLRGSTNPPPEGWFHRCETWRGPCQQQGLTVVVPQDAQQVLVFLAPETGGDFRTLVGAVRGRPGAFVRASLDLNQASLDRSRLETYLAAIRALDMADRSRLRDAAPLLARSLAIKVDEKCLDRIPELRAPCLMQGQDALILNDGHSTSIVEALTAGPAADLAMEASYTPQLSYGYYSPYIASVLDIARILSSIGSAHYQYIPALGSSRGNKIALWLNTPPSFHDPQSVLVAALPAVEPPQLPPLHAVSPKEAYCARKASLVLPAEGAPLVFSAAYAHDMRLRLLGASGQTIELPASADPEQGGIVIDTSSLSDARLGESVHAVLHGYWGFERYEGPAFRLVTQPTASWELAASENGSVIGGRENTVRLRAATTSCLRELTLLDSGGGELKPEWKLVGADNVEVKLPLQAAKPGALTLLVAQYGADQPQPVALQVYVDASHLESFVVHAGDAQGVLKGTRLDEVDSLLLRGIQFAPSTLSSSKSGDELIMSALDPKAASGLKQGDTGRARVKLKDGRQFYLDTVVVARRPGAVLLAKNVLPSSAGRDRHLLLDDPAVLPQDAKLTFSVRAQPPTTFAHDATVEVATTDDSVSTVLGVGHGITLENVSIAVATLDPMTAFGTSAFGPLRFRVIAAGVAGDWQPLVTLVRLPELRELTCPSTPELACKLSGSDLFLVDSVAGDPSFAQAVQVPEGFPGYSLPVPHPSGARLYIKLRDDPSVVIPAELTVKVLPPSPDQVARAALGQASDGGSSPRPENTTTSGPEDRAASRRKAGEPALAPTPDPAAPGIATEPAIPESERAPAAPHSS